MVSLRMSRIVFAAKDLSQKQLNDIAHEHTIICRQLFAGHVVGSRPMKRKKHLHRMIIRFIILIHIDTMKCNAEICWSIEQPSLFLSASFSVYCVLNSLVFYLFFFYSLQRVLNGCKSKFQANKLYHFFPIFFFLSVHLAFKILLIQVYTTALTVH